LDLLDYIWTLLQGLLSMVRRGSVALSPDPYLTFSGIYGIILLVGSGLNILAVQIEHETMTKQVLPSGKQ
jgi:hypothetical protein